MNKLDIAALFRVAYNPGQPDGWQVVADRELPAWLAEAVELTWNPDYRFLGQSAHGYWVSPLFLASESRYERVVKVMERMVARLQKVADRSPQPEAVVV